MIDICRDTIRKIYGRIHEEVSRRIYADRLAYSLTADRTYVREIMKYTTGGGIDKLVKPFNKFILFGGGIWGGNILWVYPDLNWLCVWDNNPQKDTLTSNNKGFSDEKVELPVEKYTPGKPIPSDTAIVISSRLYHGEIYAQIIAAGVPQEQIIDAGGIIDDLSKKQYFDLPYLPKADDEVFVDAGAFDGETSIQFHKAYGGRYKEIIAFEPDENNIQKFQKKMAGCDCHDITLIKQGLWNRETELSFTSIGNGSSTIDEDGKQTIRVGRLDDLIPSDKRISFIKMDLEGAEYRALLGAERTIRMYRPKLAISLYHKPEDVWEIPELILSYNPDYKFYLRHYSIAASETVLYAV